MIKTWCVQTCKRQSQNVPKVCHSASTFFAHVPFLTHVFTGFLPQKWSKMGPKNGDFMGPKWSILGTPFEHPFSALFRPIGDGVPRSLLVTIPPRSSPYGALDRHDVSSPRTHGKSCDWWIGPSKSDVKNSRFSPLFNRVLQVLPKMAILEKPCLCKVVTVKVKTCQKCHIPP